MVTFLGRREDVPALLKQADMLVLSSDYEGFPNVVLEAMAARLPVITTPAGDANIAVQNGNTGYVVHFDDVTGMAECMVRLSKSPGLRWQLGEAARKRVEQHFSFEHLAGRLLSIYRKSALQHNRTDLLRLWSDKDVAQAEIDLSLPPLT
jgi:glycosyltransferase involved in cell wall biosynthesis